MTAPIQFRALVSDLANVPDRRDTGTLADYRALCGRVYFAALQIGTSGAYPSKTLDGFPSVKSKAPKKAPTLAKAFDLMGLSQLRAWSKQFSDWFCKLPEADKARMLDTDCQP